MVGVKYNWKGIGILFLLGASLGSLGDLCHVLSQTTTYPEGVYGFYFFGLLPFWVPLLFGSAALAVGVSHVWMDRLLVSWGVASPYRPGLCRRGIALFSPIIFVVLYGLSGFISWGDLWLPAAAWGIWYLLDRSWQGMVLGFLTACAGTAVELSLVHTDVFSYLSPKDSFYGVASWLPWLYVLASVTIGNLGRFLFQGR